MIAAKVTSTPKLAIDGGSNGGLLVGATVTQHPNLFTAAIAEQGVLDMLRYEKFTVGYNRVPEYGRAEAGAARFKNLHAYAPLHNVEPGTAYPAGRHGSSCACRPTSNFCGFLVKNLDFKPKL